MKIFNYFFLFVFNFKIIDSYQHYYLFKNIQKIIKIKYSNHINLGYHHSKKILFQEFKKDLIYGNNQNYNIHSDVNCEHLWCQKYFNYKEPMKSDLHILYLSNSKINSHRQDYKFSNVEKNFIFINEKGNIINNNFFNKLISGNLYKKNNSKKIFEPCNRSKGKISRGIAYFDTIYDNKNIHHVIDKKDLVIWNRKYLPNIYEIERNELIRNHQKNINPFIKYPILIEFFYSDQISPYNILKLSFYSLFTIFFSDIFKFNNYLKKNIG